MLKFPRIRPPIRRVLALDAGSRRLKLLLLESNFGQLRILKEQLLDLQEEGLVSNDEIKGHLHTLIENFGSPPVGLILPQHLSTSQVIELPAAPESEVAKLIEEETFKLSGVSESRIIYDFVRLEDSAPPRQHFWVTLAQEGHIREHIARLGLEHEDLSELTTTANALLAAYGHNRPLSQRAILVHMGAETTVLIVLSRGHGAFASSFQMGGDFLMRALARLRNCSEEAAESIKRSRDLLHGPEASAEFAAIVDGWVRELKRQLEDCFQHNPAIANEISSFELIASGGGFDQPGLLDYLKAKGGLSFRPWVSVYQKEAVAPAKGFEVAFGAALQALGLSAQPASLLPEDYRNSWRKRLNTQKLEIASLALAVICLLLLGAGTWRQFSLINRKQAMLSKVEASQEKVDNNNALMTDLVSGYEGLRPFFAAQQNTSDTLKTLALLQESRSNRSLWYLLAADQQSYFSHPPSPPPTNKPAASANPPGVERLNASSTNLAKPGLIVELSIPEEPESARLVLRQLVNDLKQQRLFSKVDLLSDDVRRNLAEPKVLLSDRDFVLALDFAETEFQPSSRPRKAASQQLSKRNQHPWTTLDSDSPAQNTP